MKAPKILCANRTKGNKFRRQTHFPIGDTRRYPIGAYSVPVDVSIGKIWITRPVAALRINSNAAIRNSSNKIRTKTIWTEHGIPHCEPYSLMRRYFRVTIDYDKIVEEIGFPLVLKHTSLSGGRGMYFIHNRADLIRSCNRVISTYGAQTLRERYFLESFFDFDREYRVHVAPPLKGVPTYYSVLKSLLNEEGSRDVVPFTETREDGVIFSIRKMMRRDAYEAGQVNRNHRSGSVYYNSNFVRPASRWNDIITDAVEAINVLGLDTGFVDVMYNSDTKVYRFSESGANPGMDMDLTVQYYRQAFKKIIQTKLCVE